MRVEGRNVDLLMDILMDAAIDTVKLIPFLYLCYLLMEFIEHKAGDRFVDGIRNTRSAGPFVGALLGAFPQCGFSAAAATLYAGRVVTIGTLIAVFLATSDEMLPIFLAEQVDIAIIGKVLGAKVELPMIDAEDPVISISSQNGMASLDAVDSRSGLQAVYYGEVWGLSDVPVYTQYTGPFQNFFCRSISSPQA